MYISSDGEHFSMDMENTLEKWLESDFNMIRFRIGLSIQTNPNQSPFERSVNAALVSSSLLSAASSPVPSCHSHFLSTARAVLKVK